ncbi:MAG: hypothetical protein CMC76_11945 [Flavobacteriaceae bacterium]|nr:hypothetical protein [Flavobacteriaceae bacterium]|tara:strand:- start:2446 stop:3003 length:558 start_codon:yes stop_codon:yes gene_type:complete
MRLYISRRKIVAIKRFFNRYKTVLTYFGLITLTISNIFLRRDVIELELELQNIKNENQSLIADMVYFNRSFEDFPLPVWQKVKRDGKFVMQYVNKAYYERYLIPRGLDRYDYMGSTDFDIYDYKTATIFYARDLSLAIDGDWKRFDESILDAETSERIKLDVFKWRIIERKDTLIYGMVVPEKMK